MHTTIQPTISLTAARPAPEMQQRLGFLDGVRALAAISVFIAHAGVALSASFAAFTFRWFEPGQFGVVIFFLCSGFIIPVSLERHSSLKRFWMQRLCRLYPLYWLSIALVVVAAGLGLIHIDTEATGAAWITVLANTSMLQMFLGVPHLINVYWTLSFELLFYVLVSIFFVLGLGRRSTPIALGWIGAALVVEVGIPRIIGVRVATGIVSYLATMYVGTVFYRLHSGEARPYSAALVIAGALVMAVGTNISGSQLLPHYVTAQIAAYGVFGLVFLGRSKQAPRSILYLGRISYSVYLIHPFILILIPPLGGTLMTGSIWFASVTLIASLTYRWIEQPGIALGRYLTQPKPATATLTAGAAQHRRTT